MSSVSKKREAENTAATATAPKKIKMMESQGSGIINGHAPTGSEIATVGDSKPVTKVEVELKEQDMASLSRTCTGVLASPSQSRDLKIHNFSVNCHGFELLGDTHLELNAGNRYGLIGLSGCGKSTLLAVIAHREIPIPAGLDIFHLHREMAPVDKTALQCVMEINEERMRLEKEAEELAHAYPEASHDKLMDFYERLDEIGEKGAETRAADILHGLGFTKQMQQTKVKEFSVGWRTRLTLARALYLKPAILLLDEPTNHLDLNACAWLEEELKSYKKILVVISHSQNFLNSVCTHTINLDQKQLRYYGGNYEFFARTRADEVRSLLKPRKWEDEQIDHMKALEKMSLDKATLVSWCYQNFFPKLVLGCFVKVDVQKYGVDFESVRPTYQIGRIVGISELKSPYWITTSLSPGGPPSDTRTNWNLVVRFADGKSDFLLDDVSRQKGTGQEVAAYLDSLERDGFVITDHRKMESKMNELDEIVGRPTTDEDFQEFLANQRKCLSYPWTLSIRELHDLLPMRKLKAVQSKDFKRAVRIQEQLDDLLAYRPELDETNAASWNPPVIVDKKTRQERIRKQIGRRRSMSDAKDYPFC